MSKSAAKVQKNTFMEILFVVEKITLYCSKWEICFILYKKALSLRRK